VDVPNVHDPPGSKGELVSDSDDSQSTWRPHLPRTRNLVIASLVGLMALWLAPVIAAAVASIDLSTVENPYRVIFGFVVFDAVIPIFPSESLLTTASTQAAQDGSTLELGWLILAGSLGAIVGDSLLYWLSRTVLRRKVGEKVELARADPKVAHSLEAMSQSAGALIVFGRFIPGVRFMVGATMGLTRYPYPKFLLWDSIGGVLWASYTCIFSFLVASKMDGQPAASIAVSVIVTTALLGLLYRPLKHHWENTAPPTVQG
jgi:membrane protein DedA with SNARE-associated domain